MRQLVKDYGFKVYLANDEDKKERCPRCASPIYYYFQGTTKSMVFCRACGDSIMANQRRYLLDE